MERSGTEFFSRKVDKSQIYEKKKLKKLWKKLNENVEKENIENFKTAIIFFLVDILGVCMQTLKIVQIRPWVKSVN